MVDTPTDAPFRAIAALRPYVEPALRSVGWFVFFLMLAPVVGPRDYGLFILALGGVAIAEAMLVETATGVLAHLPALEARHLSTALGTTIAAAAGLSLILHIVARALGSLVDEAAADMLQPLSLLPLLGALTVVPTALRRRSGRRAPLVAATTAGTAAGGGAALALAWAGAGPWSLVAQIIVQRFLECAILWGMTEERVDVAWSRTHFVELVGAFDLRALRGAWPTVSRYGPCLVVGSMLGPTAAGLYMLASRIAEALSELCLARPAALVEHSLSEIARRACQAIPPAIIGSAVLAIALPPLVDLRWWGAVLPAQILLLGAISTAVAVMRAACVGGGAAEARWQTIQTLGGLAAIAVAARFGLVAVATAALMSATALALASLWPIRQRLGAKSGALLAAAARPCASAGVGGLLVYVLAGPVGLALDPVPALCLLIATGWLCCLLFRGAPTVPASPARASRSRLWRANPA